MASTVYTAQDAAYWYVPLVRAIPAAVLACIVTFAGGNYSPDFGLYSFGGFAVVSGVLGGILAIRALTGAERSVFVIQGVVSVAAGLVALIGANSGLAVFLGTVGVWGIVSGVLELYAGIRARGRRGGARDWIFIGIVAVLLGLVAFVIPPDYVQHYTGPNKEPRTLNTSVMVVGALAVYGAIAAVYLAIAAFSQKWGAAAAAKETAEVAS